MNKGIDLWSLGIMMYEFYTMELPFFRGRQYTQVQEDPRSGPEASKASATLVWRWRASIKVKEAELLKPLLPWVSFERPPDEEAVTEADIKLVFGARRH